MNNREWYYEASQKIKEKMLSVASKSIGKIPYTTINGTYNDQTDSDICWWTNGFYGGIMWQLYNATHEDIYKESAIIIEEKLDKNFLIPNGMDHDSGFKWLPTSGAHYRLTGDKKALDRTITAANNLSGRFNIRGNYIRAWNDNFDGGNAGVAIIDCLMNLPLLYFAYEETKDPRFLHIATAHADTVMEYFVRDDYSVIHIGTFDPYTGKFLKSLGGQGYCEGSSWTRGQAWAIYGFALSYIHTHNPIYLETAINISDYFISCLNDDYIVPVDFMQPEDCTYEDSTAALIAACGMIEISKAGGDKCYRDTGELLLRTIYEKRCDFTPSQDNIVNKCTAAFHDKEHEFAIIYGDYYFIEGIFKLTGEELFIW